MPEFGATYRQAMVMQPSASSEDNTLEQKTDADLLRWSTLLDFENYSR